MQKSAEHQTQFRRTRSDPYWKHWAFLGWAPQAPRGLEWLWLVWHLLVNVAMLAVSYAAFAIVTSRFETMVVAFFFILWVGVRLAFSNHRQLFREWMLHQDVRYCRLLELLNDQDYQSAEAKERTARDQEAVAAALQARQWSTMIYELGWAALFLLAAYRLILAVYPALISSGG